MKVKIANTLETLLGVGMCYTKDLKLYLQSGTSAATASKHYKLLKDKGYINELVIKTEYAGESKVCSISDVGFARLCDMNPDKEEYYREYRGRIERRFRGKREDRENSLALSRIELMFESNSRSGIAVRKPSLPALFHALSESSSIPPSCPPSQSPASSSSLVYSSYTPDEIRAMFNQGILYSRKELFDFIGERMGEIKDIFFQSRIRAIYLSPYQCFLIVMSKRGKGTYLRIRTQHEKRLLTILKELLFNCTDIYRPLLKPNKDDNNIEYKKTLVNKPEVIVISDGKMMVHAIATGNPQGKTTEEKDKQGFISERNRDEPGTQMLIAKTRLYERLYIIPCNSLGLTSLGYLLDYTTESYWQDSKELFELLPGFSSVPLSETMYPELNGLYLPSNLLSVYMPYYEAKTLRRLHDLDIKPCIVTFPDMCDAIAHSIRKPAVYISALSGEEIKDVIIYDHYGNPAGRDKMVSFLSDLGLEPVPGILPDLHLKLNMSEASLWNGVYDGSISPESLLEKIETREFTLKKRTYKKMRQAYLPLPKKEYDKLKQMAADKGVTVSYLLKGLLYSSLNSPEFTLDDDTPQNKENKREDTGVIYNSSTGEILEGEGENDGISDPLDDEGEEQEADEELMELIKKFQSL